MQGECYSCMYSEYDNGDVSGNPNCLNLDQANSTEIEGLISTCPRHISMGCFTGSALHDIVSIFMHNINFMFYPG